MQDLDSGLVQLVSRDEFRRRLAYTINSTFADVPIPISRISAHTRVCTAARRFRIVLRLDTCHKSIRTLQPPFNRNSLPAKLSCGVGWTARGVCHLSQARRVADSIQPPGGWFCYFLGSKRCGNVGSAFQSAVDVWNAVGRAICPDRAIPNLGSVLLCSLAERAHSLRGDEPSCHRGSGGLETANGRSLPRFAAVPHQRR